MQGEYIHYNPCSERWKLCSVPEEYPYSNAKDYIFNKRVFLEMERDEMY